HAPWPGPSPSRPTPTVQPSTTKEAKRPSKKMKVLAHKPPSSAAPNAPLNYPPQGGSYPNYLP
ncbi:hypothetical protein BHE74_00057916, partial [Ensete ventricosum]